MMKRSLLSLAGGLLLFGCSPAPDPVVQKEPKPSKTAPVDSTSVPVKPSTPAEVLSNPDRIHQLKDLKVATLKLNGHAVSAWVMDTESKREEGMMFLKDSEVKPEQGMLFLFPIESDSSHGFWMHNTLIPLDIVYVDAKGKVVSIAHGKPKDETTLKPDASYLNVVELKAGEAEKLGLKKRSVVEIPKDLKANE